MSGNITQKSKSQKSRRSFLNTMLGGSIVGFTGSMLYPVVRFMIPPKVAESNPNTIMVGSVDDLKPNSGRIIRFGNKPVMLIKTPQGETRAFSAICTHLACIVQYREDLKHIWCACHNGHFDLLGKNVAGPPPRPLPPYEVNIKDDNVYVSKIT